GTSAHTVSIVARQIAGSSDFRAGRRRYAMRASRAPLWRPPVWPFLLPLLDGLHEEAARDDPPVPDPEQGDPPVVELRPVHPHPMPPPFRPHGVPVHDGPNRVRPEVRHAGEDRGPVLADLLPAAERLVRVRGLLALVLRVDEGDEPLDVVRVPR